MISLIITFIFMIQTTKMNAQPLKRSEYIVKLSRDHHASLLLCWKLRQGIKYHIAPERMACYVRYAWDHLFAAHFKEEEEILFAPVKDEAVQKAIRDHRDIKAQADHIISHAQELKAADFLKFADTVNDHVRYEERVLFPHLEKVLSEEQLQKISAALSPEAIIDGYEDDFWVKPHSL